MEVIIQADAAAATRFVAGSIGAAVRTTPGLVLGLATGRTQVPVYAELVRMHQEDGLSFAGTTTFNLDEYVGVSPANPGSYSAYMAEHFFDHVDVAPDNAHLLDGTTADVPATCAAFEGAIRSAGGIDLQLLGIGAEGHIGFNEPASSLTSRTRIKTLTARTRHDNAGDFPSPEDVPHHVLTMGVGTIMDARTCLLLAVGESKAAAIHAAVEGPITATVPASILQMHPDARIVVDEAAASELARAEYFREVWDGKPDWQREF